MKDELDTPDVHFLKKNGIVIATIKNSASPVTLPKAILILGDRLTFQEGRSYPLMVKTEGWISMDKAARAYFAKEGMTGVLAGVLLARNPLEKSLVAFITAFMPISNVPYRVYHKEEVAMKWLETFIK